MTATDGYAISQQKRKRIEQGFGWAKTVGHIRQVMVRGLEKVGQMLVHTMSASQPHATAHAGTGAPISRLMNENVAGKGQLWNKGYFSSPLSMNPSNAFRAELPASQFGGFGACVTADNLEVDEALAQSGHDCWQSRLSQVRPEGAQ